MEKNLKKNIYIYESLCCILETLYINCNFKRSFQKYYNSYHTMQSVVLMYTVWQV